MGREQGVGASSKEQIPAAGRGGGHTRSGGHKGMGGTHSIPSWALGMVSLYHTDHVSRKNEEEITLPDSYIKKRWGGRLHLGV